MNALSRIIAPPERRRLPLRADDFELLADNGAFADYGKVELIDGQIYYMNAQWSRHARAKSRLLVLLANRLAAIDSDLEAISEVSVRLNGGTMPERDIIIARAGTEKTIKVESVAVIIEVSDTTLDTDLGRKSELYAAAGVPESRVIDLNENRVVMHEHPGPDGYAGHVDILLGGKLISATIEGIEVARCDYWIDGNHLGQAAFGLCASARVQPNRG